MNELVNESVDVIVKYKGIKVEIIKFKRGQTEYNVSSIGNSWKESVGDTIITHYPVICERQGISGELSYNDILHTWTLVQYDILEC